MTTKYGGSDRPSRAEQAATRWHQQHHPDAWRDCWCCCRACRTQNPHHLAACTAALADIRARIIASIREVRIEARRNGRDEQGRFAYVPPQPQG